MFQGDFSLRDKCLNTEFLFCSEYRKIRTTKKSVFEHFSRSVFVQKLLLTKINLREINTDAVANCRKVDERDKFLNFLVRTTEANPSNCNKESKYFELVKIARLYFSEAIQL